MSELVGTAVTSLPTPLPLKAARVAAPNASAGMKPASAVEAAAGFRLVPSARSVRSGSTKTFCLADPAIASSPGLTHVGAPDGLTLTRWGWLSAVPSPTQGHSRRVPGPGGANGMSREVRAR